ncbi:ethanolamine ammonia-lyase reactivating factor EutA [Paenibacillus sp. OAS669]|uniref:ethanolamine ammonia-lyase reactivating factor EutA n=1 Tax=Paenibacillus sp. OAS669 TaxID=2663821 RepID=UPI0017897046|nr:ethanolamine ammonia-lyase reactivating factor EutA [Paenibacillus sp. OAS669]MBE1445430.1 ethanolamine utilization protein EutA [Paenibacillus sp. OAS669]
MDNRSGEHWITSVGIDIGTSTTKMIISRLRLARTSGALSLPRYDIVERELLYASPIYGTPLISADEIDAERIGELLAEDYARAGVRASELKSGAVIITGETATKANARQIVHLLAERAGDFVVAAAGPDLEGLLAGKGAGAEQRSRHTRGAVVNIDIGGGTANAAIFQRGRPAGTMTFHVGGRLIELDRRGTVTAVSGALKPWLDANGFQLEPGQTVSYGLLKQICTGMCQTLLEGLLCPMTQEPMKEDTLKLVLGRPLPVLPPVEEWMISGGVGRLMALPKPLTLEQTAVHGDIGPLLAHAMKECLEASGLRLIQAEETVRATVIGAGMQSTEISGATVHVDEKLLPIRNVPVVKLELAAEALDRPGLLEQPIDHAMAAASSLYERNDAASASIAVALPAQKYWSYAVLQRLSALLVEGYKRYFPESKVMAVICANDIAKALGQSLARHSGGRPDIICIDQITVEHGDYIDLGEPIGGMMIPVVVKTLAFHGGNRR